jgi:hypothetical protein
MRMTRPGLWCVVACVAAACGGNDDGGKPSPTPEPEPLKTYAVKGSITGLSGELTLQLNGQERLTRAADGAFAFQTRLEDQAQYAVGVATPPAEQDCSVEAGTGRVSGADVESVRVRCATRTYALGGSVEGGRAPVGLRLEGETLALPASGRFTFTTRLPRGRAYAVSLVDAPSGLQCTVSGGEGSVAGAVEDIAVRCRDVYTLTTGQAASGVLGQADFTQRLPNRGGGGTNAGTLNGPLGNAVAVGGRLYVSDLNSNRVLGFNSLPSAPGASADFVLGQPDLFSADSGTGRGGLKLPAGLGGDATRLAVADQRNSRVLLYTPPAAASATPPTLVLGQAAFDSETPGCTSQWLGLPQDVFIGQGKVLVADTGHHRVLVWNTAPSVNGQPADLVLGQQSFTVCRRNDANGDGTSDARPGASTLYNPTGVWTDGTRLVVVDSYNNRVLLWNTFPTVNGQPADVVLGQPGFDTSAAALSATGLDNPTTVTSTGQQLFVTDTQNHRVLVWNTLPTRSATPPDLVLGQADFTHEEVVDPATGAPSARSLNQPGGITLAWPYVIVTDTGDHRLLLWRGTP